MKHRKKQLTLASGIILSAFFLYLALRGVDFQSAAEALAKTNFLFIIPAVLIIFADFSMRALRWSLLLEPIKKCRFSNVISTLFIGFFANTALPLRAGEVIRSIIIGEKEKISKSAAMATIVVERTMDLFAVFVLFSLSLLLFPPNELPFIINRLWKIGGIFLISTVLILYGLMYYRDFTLNVLQKTLKKLPPKISKKGIELLNSFILGLDILKKTGHLLLCLVFSLIIWSLNSLAFFFVARGMGISNINLYNSAFVMGVVSTGISIPAAPGFIGTYQYFGVLALRVLRVPKSVAISFTVLDHALRLTCISAGGLFFLTREHLSISKLEKKAEKESVQEE
ncbi:MAG: lysylphosphatidylglycerol synthase transmembrane domain-containing protein [Elusimicrobiota bacterium]